MCIDRSGLMDRPEEAWRWVPVPAGRTVGFIGEAAGSLQIEYAVASICRFLCIPWARGGGGGWEVMKESSPHWSRMERKDALVKLI